MPRIVHETATPTTMTLLSRETICSDSVTHNSMLPPGIYEPKVAGENHLRRQ